MDFVPDSTTEVLGFVPQGDAVRLRQLCLVVTLGPEKGVIHTLQPGTTVLGRSANDADWVLAGRGLSRAHARILLNEQGECSVEDMGSTNGVFVNGMKVQSSPLEPGDQIALGPDVLLTLDAPQQSINSLLQEMHRGATRDALTGMTNRRSFLDRLEQEISATSRHALNTCVAMLDVDHFKKINDTYGHPAGDAVLIELARRLQETVRTEDVAARFGGEEFVLMLPLTQLEGGKLLLERVRKIVADAPFDVPTPSGSQSIAVTLSAGLTAVTAGQTPEQVLEKADVCLYEAKRAGRNRVVVSSDIE